MKWLCMLYISLVFFVVPGRGMSQTAGLHTKDKKLVFFDLWKLDYWDNLELEQGEPKWIAEVSYTDPTTPTSGIYFPSVLPPQADGKWRMLYSTQ